MLQKYTEEQKRDKGDAFMGKVLGRYIVPHPPIIIPEIGQQGQKKLLYSTVLVYCEDINSLWPLAYYLAALGIGKILCDLKDNRGAGSLFADVMDFNNDTSIDYLKGNDNSGDFSEEKERVIPPSFCRIILGNYDYVKSLAAKLLNEKYIPTVISVNNQWKGKWR